MTFDKDQVREAVEWADEFWQVLGVEPTSHLASLFAVARAFVDGSLLPAKPDEHCFRHPWLRGVFHPEEPMTCAPCDCGRTSEAHAKTKPKPDYELNAALAEGAAEYAEEDAAIADRLIPAKPDYEAACWALIEARRRAGYDVSAITELGLTLGDVILMVDAALAGKQGREEQ